MDKSKVTKMTTAENIKVAESLVDEMKLMSARMVLPDNSERVRSFGVDLYGLVLLAGIGIETLKEMHRQGKLEPEDKETTH